ncbi:hypothetical protein N0V82_001324 [Gnomoniopsis sp. IMI 355080]|nr:hypothetical protein N0V82_001324 [Gnomoniopsis sp. IMI 355080]
MTSNNPRNKPLHRVRNIRNAAHNAKQFPQLAESLFDPAHTRATVYDPFDPQWRKMLAGDGGIVAPVSLPPQPTMQQFYNSHTGSLNPRPFADQADRDAYIEDAKTAGFVPFIRNGTNQFKAMMQLGLDPRLPPTEEEVRRREENEARVQVFRDKMTLDTIMENSGGGKWRKQGAFPGWTETLPVQKEVKARAVKKIKQAEVTQKPAAGCEDITTF